MRILNDSGPIERTETKSATAIETSKPRKKKGREIVKHGGPNKNLSDRDIRAKIERMKMKNEVKAPKPIHNEVKSDMPGDVTAKVVNAQGEPIKSDVSKNDPKDPVTQEKLRAILKSGAFSFNQKEKGALADILKGGAN